ncbi:TrpB-like pyridoxal phosphate-dependent enzyme [Geothrix mesophila]|uniref:TrpB-like pyridoxal phosphate-dependent enzyme n=1 Tax=Geothrix mesophila TaxID=2922723 RepID=UPI001FAE1FA0
MSSRAILSDQEIPRQWYNLAADLPHAPLPPLGPDGQPVAPEALAAVFPMNLIEQEMSQERWIGIPDEVLEILLRYRPTPLHRARALEAALKTPARIYYKNESVSPAGSHKVNTAIAQAYYNKVAGIRRITSETGAGQWGSSIAFACGQFGLECKVYMVRVSFDQKPFRKMMMRTWGADCVASPSPETAAGRAILAEDPDCRGSLGIAISEAVEAAVTDPTGQTRYTLGSVLNHVLLHQTIIGLEAQKQLAALGEKKVDKVIGCVGGGSNFAGLSFPFVKEKIAGADIDIIAVEPASCPTLTRAPYVYDHGDVAKMTPLMAMHSLGHTFMPPGIHAGGLRYHGMAPLVSQTVVEGLTRAVAIQQLECFDAAVRFARTEGIIPAPESSHAIAQAIREAEQAREEGKERVILFNLSGHGLMDLNGYADFLDGKLSDHALSEEEMARSLACLAGLPRPAAF